MDTQVNLTNIPCANKEEVISTLKRLIYNNDDLMPHQVASATGCDFRDATYILMLLYLLDLAEAFLFVYHNEHLDSGPIDERKLVEGFPKLPFKCSYCEQEINDKKELSYDFVFKLLNKNIEFTVHQNDKTEKN